MAHDMRGKVVVITGANSGIGRETAAELARGGARVLCGARDRHKGEAAVERIRADTGNSSVELLLADLAEMAQVRSLAHQVRERTDRLDVLIHNAGIILSERTLTPDGFEATFAINHLAPFLLTQELRELLVASAPARVVTVASRAHRFAATGLDFDDLQSERGYHGLLVYSRSKLANILFTRELARRLAGTGVTANCVHPGAVRTGFARDGDTRGWFRLGWTLILPFIRSPKAGARTSVYVASAPELEQVSGEYFSNCKVARPSKVARDDAAAARLWRESEALL